MPKVPTDYTKTIIYKLVHKEDYDNANVYIGSTTNFRQKGKVSIKIVVIMKIQKNIIQKNINIFVTTKVGMNGI